MAKNRVIFTASLLYSLILVLNYGASSISQLIRSITHLLTSSTDNDYSLIYSTVMKFIFIYTVSTLFFSTATIFASYSSFRQLITAISRHWKPFLTATAAAAVFPAVLRPPSMPKIPFATFYFNATLLHAVFVVFLSAKLVVLPMLEERFGAEGLVTPKGLSWKFVFCIVLMGIVQVGTVFLSKEAYKMQVGFGVLWEVVQIIWLAGTFELMVFAVLNYEKRKKLAGAGTSDRSEEVTPSAVNLARV